MILKELAEKREHKFFPGYTESYPKDWSAFIDFADKCYRYPEPEELVAHKEEFMKGGRVRRGNLQIWGYMTMFGENPDGSDFPEMEEIRRIAVSEYGHEPRTSFAILNLSGEENITNRHADLTHNLYIQCIGNVTWKVYKSQDSNEFSQYELYPGDAIYVPAGVFHEVESSVPRTAVTFGFPDLTANYND